MEIVVEVDESLAASYHLGVLQLDRNEDGSHNRTYEREHIDYFVFAERFGNKYIDANHDEAYHKQEQEHPVAHVAEAV